MERRDNEILENVAKEFNITIEQAKELLTYFSDDLLYTPYIPMMDTKNGYYITETAKWEFNYTVPILRSERIPLIKIEP